MVVYINEIDVTDANSPCSDNDNLSDAGEIISIQVAGGSRNDCCTGHAPYSSFNIQTDYAHIEYLGKTENTTGWGTFHYYITPFPPTPTPPVTPDPTPDPTPTGISMGDPGTLWFVPREIAFDQTIVATYEPDGGEAVEPGPDGFIAAVGNPNPGSLIISGFDATGSGPGTDLHLFTIYVQDKRRYKNYR